MVRVLDIGDYIFQAVEAGLNIHVGAYDALMRVVRIEDLHALGLRRQDE